MELYLYAIPSSSESTEPIHPISTSQDYMHPADFVQQSLKRDVITEGGRYIVAVNAVNGFDQPPPKLFFFTVIAEQTTTLKLLQ